MTRKTGLVEPRWNKITKADGPPILGTYAADCESIALGSKALREAILSQRSRGHA